MTAFATPISASATSGASLLASLAVILTVAAVTTVLFQRLRQPVVLGYLLAGLIVGPHLPVPLVADEGVAHTFSELGVILLMFGMGLEFSLKKLVRVAGSAGIVAVIECSLMLWLGYLVAGALGWTRQEGLFTGALIAISSTTIILKAFEERGVKGRISEVVFGILIFEDLIAVVLLAVLTAVASGAEVSLGHLARIAGRLGGLLALSVVAGLLVVPRLVRMVVRVGRPETIVIACVGICFAFALLEEQLGYSVALGAFLAGALVSESGEVATIEPLVAPVRDVFAAVFFVAVGMQIDPRLIWVHAPAVGVLTLVVIAGKLVGVSFGAFLAGHDVRTSIQAGMSLAQIGEFSFIIAGVGVSAGVTRPFLYPVAVAISAVTTLVTPWLIRASGAFAAFVDRKLPHALQTYASLYGSWVQRLHEPRTPGARRIPRLPRLAAFLALDAALVAGIVIATALAAQPVERIVRARFGLAPRVAHALVLGAAALAAGPFVAGTIRVARTLGAALAAEALPAQGDGVDLAAAPRRGLVVGLQLMILVLVGVPFLAIVQPFVPVVPMAVALAVGLGLLAWPLWRTATNVDAHARAGALAIKELLAAEARSADHGAGALHEARHLIPGLGDPVLVELAAGSAGVGRTLKGLDLRGLTGATVVALRRPSGETLVPTGDEPLAAGDVLVLAGSADAVRAARARLVPPAP
ncbi:MAG TPA: cation:proton antiporter [Polyangia bacterium]|nr:cation:proton antiporter [Polyangia bacterium]